MKSINEWVKQALHTCVLPQYRWIWIVIVFVLAMFQLHLVIRNVAVNGATKTPFRVDQDSTAIAALQKRIEKQQAQLDILTPGRPYIVINTAANEFSLYRSDTLVRRDKCSTGSYILLKNEKKQWMFKTPKGEFKVRAKNTKPVWKKPDWAFVEEGLPIPSGDHPSRYEYGVLGDYSLALGDGYLIHGTLYQRFLGLAVTHGCVRLNDENLKLVYETLSVGSKVYIF